MELRNAHIRHSSIQPTSLQIPLPPETTQHGGKRSIRIAQVSSLTSQKQLTHNQPPATQQASNPAAIAANNKAISQLLKDSKSTPSIVLPSKSAQQTHAQPPRFSLDCLPLSEAMTKSIPSIVNPSLPSDENRNAHIQLLPSYGAAMTEPNGDSEAAATATAAAGYISQSSSHSPLVKGRLKTLSKTVSSFKQDAKNVALPRTIQIISTGTTGGSINPANVGTSSSSSSLSSKAGPQHHKKDEARRSCTAIGVNSKRRSLLANITASNSTVSTSQISILNQQNHHNNNNKSTSSSSFFSTPSPMLQSELQALKKNPKQTTSQSSVPLQDGQSGSAAQTEQRNSYGITPFLASNQNRHSIATPQQQQQHSNYYSTFNNDEEHTSREKSKTTILNVLSNKRHPQISENHITLTNSTSTLISSNQNNQNSTVNSNNIHNVFPQLAHSISGVNSQENLCSHRGAVINSTYYTTATPASMTSASTVGASASASSTIGSGFKGNKDKKFMQQLSQLTKIVHIQNSPSKVQFTSSLSDLQLTARGTDSIEEQPSNMLIARSGQTITTIPSVAVAAAAASSSAGKSGSQVFFNFEKLVKDDIASIEAIFEQQLRRDVPCSFSDVPSTRQEVIQLNKWVGNQLSVAQRLPTGAKKSNSIDAIVSLASKELLRQISLECSERGDLFSQIFQFAKVSLEEKVEEACESLARIRKSTDEELARQTKKYEETFREKEYEIAVASQNIADLTLRIKKSDDTHEDLLKKNKHLRDSLYMHKEIIEFLKKKHEYSNAENAKLRLKITKLAPNKFHRIQPEQLLQQQLTSEVQSPSLKKTTFTTTTSSSSPKKTITPLPVVLTSTISGTAADSPKKSTPVPHILLSKASLQLNNSNNNNTKQDSLNNSNNSDLFGDIENHLSERQIELEGVSETIDNLNYVPFTNPDDYKKQESNSVQTGLSLLEFCGVIAEHSTQTELQDLLDPAYDTLLNDKAQLDRILTSMQTIEAQVDYLKQRELSLLQQIESLKAQSVFAATTSTKGGSDATTSLSNFATPKAQLSLSTMSVSMLNLPKLPTVTAMTSLNQQRKPQQQTPAQQVQSKSIVSLSVASQDPSDDDGSSSEKDEEFDEQFEGLKPTKKSKAGQATKPLANNRQLGEKTGQVDSLFNDVGRSIVDKARANKFLKFRNFMPLPTVLKQIHLIYLERIRMTNENARVREQECSNFTYFFLTKLYGFKKIVDQKFIIFILSVKKYLNVFRVHLFARFVGLFEASRSSQSTNLSLDEFNKYAEVFNYVHNISTVGIAPSPYDNDLRYMVPFIRIMAFIGNFADTRMTSEENSEFRREIEQLKESDPRGVHTLGLADFDTFLSKMLAKYRQLVNRAKNYVINAFAASDLDGNGNCNLDEFLILNRHIEAENYDEEDLTAIFTESADRIIDGEANLSFDKFAVVCVDHNLFTDEAQDAFLGIRHKREIDFKMQELQAEWHFRKRELLALFDSLKLISLEQKGKWLEIIEVLSEKLQSVESSEIKPLLIAYRILQNESKQLLAQEDECRKDDDLLEKYEKQAIQDQQLQHMLIAHRNVNVASPDSSGMNSPLKGRMKHRGAIFAVSNAVLPEDNDGQQQISSSTSLAQAQENNLVDQAFDNLKGCIDREQYLMSILAFNGVQTPNELQKDSMETLLNAFDSSSSIQTKQLLFSFLKSAMVK